MLTLEVFALSNPVHIHPKICIRLRTSYIDKTKVVIATVRQDWMVESLGRKDGALYDTLHALHGLSIASRVTHMNYRVSYGEIGVLTYVGI